MPFKSKAQMKWAFANKKKWARKWAKHTPNIKRLPARVGRKRTTRKGRKSVSRKRK